MTEIARLPFGFETTLAVAGAVSVSTALFAWNQNHRKPVGGPISLAKTLWLNYALLVFLAVPFCLWRNSALSAEARTLFGWIFALFFSRAVIELWMLYFTRAWRCVHGITHDCIVLVVCAALACRLDPARDAAPLGFAILIGASLLVEVFMARQFSKIASPAEGIYFADETPRYRFVNRASWAATAIGYPALALLLWELP